MKLVKSGVGATNRRLKPVADTGRPKPANASRLCRRTERTAAAKPRQHVAVGASRRQPTERKAN